jgi:hypothetical protein
MMTERQIVWDIQTGDSATFRLRAMAPEGGIFCGKVRFIPSVTIAEHATNTWTFSVEVNTVDATTTAVSNAAQALTADADYAIVVDPVLVAAGDLIEIVGTKAASAVDQSGTNFRASGRIS